MLRCAAWVKAPRFYLSDLLERARACVGGTFLVLAALSAGCTIQTVSSGQPPPQTPAAGPRPAPPAATEPGSPARPSPGTEEHTGLRSSVSANVGVVRGLIEAVGKAPLSAESKRAYDQAAAKAHAAREALNSGKYRVAQDEASEAKRLVAPAVRELSGKGALPDPVMKLLVAQADESKGRVAGAMDALRATGNLTGMESYERASAAFADAASGARAGDGARAMRGLVTGSGHLERGTLARWPALRVP